MKYFLLNGFAIKMRGKSLTCRTSVFRTQSVFDLIEIRVSDRDLF